MPILFLAVVLWGAWVALTSFDPEAWLRLVAAVALVWHPIHEQRLGFRGAFNRAINGKYEGKSVRRMGEFTLKPLSRRMNAFQAIALATVFPALALWGPWWAMYYLWGFCAVDSWWTHAERRVPGFWSAGAAAVILPVLLCLVSVGQSAWPGVAVAIGAAVAGGLTCALPWWMAYQKVRRG